MYPNSAKLDAFEQASVMCMYIHMYNLYRVIECGYVKL